MFYIYHSNHIIDIYIYVTLILGLCFLILGLGYLLAEQNLYYEKTQGYECGFDPFSDAQDPFNVKFYLIAILFLLFDLEIIFFIPWVVSLEETNFFGFYVMVLFFFLLLIGYYYEWRKNSLN